MKRWEKSRLSKAKASVIPRSIMTTKLRQSTALYFLSLCSFRYSKPACSFSAVVR